MSLNVDEFKQVLARLGDPKSNTNRISWRRFPRLYLGSILLGLRQRRFLRNVDTFLLFVGAGRSGSTLVGSLLDAHPKIVISTELDATEFMRRGFSRLQLFALIQSNAAQFAQQGSKWTGYSYKVPGQWQGRFSDIRVIGDKRAARTAQALAESYSIETVQKKLQLPLKLVHTVRNPYDNISTLLVNFAKRFGVDPATRDHLKIVIELYFQNMAWVSRNVKSHDDVITVPLEKLISHPKETLARLCGFLNLDAPDDYLDTCADILFAKPKQTRHDIPWDPELITLVQNQSRNYDFLADYSYDA